MKPIANEQLGRRRTSSLGHFTIARRRLEDFKTCTVSLILSFKICTSDPSGTSVPSGKPLSAVP